MMKDKLDLIFGQTKTKEKSSVDRTVPSSTLLQSTLLYSILIICMKWLSVKLLINMGIKLYRYKLDRSVRNAFVHV